MHPRQAEKWRVFVGILGSVVRESRVVGNAAFVFRGGGVDLALRPPRLGWGESRATNRKDFIHRRCVPELSQSEAVPPRSVLSRKQLRPRGAPGPPVRVCAEENTAPPSLYLRSLCRELRSALTMLFRSVLSRKQLRPRGAPRSPAQICAEENTAPPSLYLRSLCRELSSALTMLSSPWEPWCSSVQDYLQLPPGIHWRKTPVFEPTTTILIMWIPLCLKVNFFLTILVSKMTVKHKQYDCADTCWWHLLIIWFWH
ncbi:uncharacterized protein LOC134738987 [Pongo pygmaeus]|uniref:uncharacterized protein LOC134738987 n=1 Tax=Pongo pygmaeus TaxID=9600 RepID=UPI00300D552F